VKSEISLDTGVTFSDSDSTPVPKFLNPGAEIFKFKNPSSVQTPVPDMSGL